MSSFSKTLRSLIQPQRLQPVRQASAAVRAPGFSYFPTTRRPRAPAQARIHVAGPASQLPQVRAPAAGGLVLGQILPRRHESSVSVAILSNSSSVLERANAQDVLNGLPGAPSGVPTRTPSPLSQLFTPQRLPPSPDRGRSPDSPFFPQKPFKQVHFLIDLDADNFDADVVETRFFDKEGPSDEFLDLENIGEDIDRDYSATAAFRTYRDDFDNLDAITKRFHQTFKVKFDKRAKSPTTFIRAFYDEWWSYFEVKDAHTDSQPLPTWEAGHYKPTSKFKSWRQSLRKVGTADEMFPDSTQPHLTCQACKDAQMVGGFETGRWAIRCERHRVEAKEWRCHTPIRRKLPYLPAQDSFWTTELRERRYNIAYPNWKLGR